MTDVECYGRIIGETPKPGPDGWFPGKSEVERATSHFVRYVTKVWIYENSIPDLAVDLGTANTLVSIAGGEV